MSDEELLGLAAIAVGYSEIQKFLWLGKELDDLWVKGEYGHGRWNPLTNDGDALRLAIKLGFCIHCPDPQDQTVVIRDYEQEYVKEDVTSDIYSATRRAIVRAAAEIGKELNEKRNELTPTEIKLREEE